MKVLIVDDEPLVRKSLSRAFRAKGHDVVEAVDGNEGLTAWLQSQPDVVFLDILMPGLSGPELLKEIRPRLQDTWKGRVILMSAYAGDQPIALAQETAHEMGADLFIPKPFEDIFSLVSKAEELLGPTSQN